MLVDEVVGRWEGEGEEEKGNGEGSGWEVFDEVVGRILMRWGVRRGSGWMWIGTGFPRLRRRGKWR